MARRVAPDPGPVAPATARAVATRARQADPDRSVVLVAPWALCDGAAGGMLVHAIVAHQPVGALA